MKKILALTSILLAGGLAASAVTITPSYGNFGSLANANFGGKGIPNNAVATTTIANGNDSITLGLTATARYLNPTVGNDGAGTFSATSGMNFGNPANPSDQSLSTHDYATWNFDWYINLTDASSSAYSFKLLYGNNTTATSSGFVIPTGTSGLTSTTSGTGQDSWNLSMGFMNNIGFDANASGVYGFELQAFDAAGDLLGSTAINVDVRSVPDTGSSVTLLGCALIGIAFFSLRQNRRQTAK